MNTSTHTTIDRAIEQSIRQTEIVHLRLADISLDDMAGLVARCDDSAHLDYWGADDGEDWRIIIDADHDERQG